jgi:uncharacterized protein (TIGR02453 family)
MIHLTENIVPFLLEIRENNNKTWFDKNRDRYQKVMRDYTRFIDDVIERIAQTDPLLAGTQAKNCVYRIFRDVRFSNDKTPYKTHLGANIAPGSRNSKLSGFYVHIEPGGNSICGGGIYIMEAPILKALRLEFYKVPEELLEILEHPEFKKYYPKLWDEGKLKMAPKGFDKDFKHIELLKYKHYIGIHSLPDAMLSKTDLPDYLFEAHRALYPLNKLCNAILEDAGLAK